MLPVPTKTDGAGLLPQAYRAWRWSGGADPGGLALDTVRCRPLLPGQVLVRNAMLGLNPVDWKTLGDAALGWAPGKVPGVDGAGTIVAVGVGVSGARLGQRVAYHQGLQQPGSFAEYTALNASVLLKMPDRLDFATAASFPCPALTAWQALEKLPQRAGQRLLLSGAGGAVGHYLVQLAVARGFVVTVLCHPRHWDRLRALGAATCVVGPLRPDDVWPAGFAERFFAVVDCVDAAHAMRLAPALLANGHVVCIQGRLEHWPNGPFGRALSLHEVALGGLHLYGDVAAWAALTAAGERMLANLVEGTLQAESHIIGDFAELPKHLLALKQRQFSGKLLLTVAAA